MVPASAIRPDRWQASGSRDAFPNKPEPGRQGFGLHFQNLVRLAPWR